jgi:hypothetical protein
MPARQLCQKFFQTALTPFHQYRQNALLDATVALTRGASLTLTSIGRYLPDAAQVKNKIKRIDRLLGNAGLHDDIPLIFKNITSMLTRQLSWCVIAVDWSGYPSQDYHVLRASLLCDGCSIPLLSRIVHSKQQNNTQIQNEFLDTLAEAINARTKVIIVTDAGFQNAWFSHIKSLGWDFIGRVRGQILLRLDITGDIWWKPLELKASSHPEYLGGGALSRTTQCEGHFYLHKRVAKKRKSRRARGKPFSPRTDKEQQASGREPWLIFTSTDCFKPREIMKLYSRRMQIEQNFRDEKNEHLGFGLRASYSRSAGRMLVLSLLATLATVVMWLLGYHAENKGIHLRWQANSLKSKRVISHLTLAENVLRHSPLIIKLTELSTVLNHLAKNYRNMVLVY